MSRPTQDPDINPYVTCTGLSPSLATLSSVIPLPLESILVSPITPVMPKHNWFGLFPFRSPLLGESLLFSSPPGT